MSDEKHRAWAQYLACEEQRGKRAADEFPYGLVETAGVRALGVWQSLKTQGKGTPLVLGGYKDIYGIGNRLALWRERGETPDMVLEAASRIRFPQGLFAMRAAQRAAARPARAGACARPFS